MAASNAQLEAQIQDINRRLAALASAMADLTPSKVTFLASLSVLPHQTTSLPNGTSGFSSIWTTQQQNALLALQSQMNGAINGVNALNQALQNQNFEN